MFSEELEEFIELALADGVLTDKERAVLHKRAQAEGVDPDELDVVIDGRLAKVKKQEDWLKPAPPQNLQNQNYGNVMKCPSCGAQVVGGKAFCPECGYNFSNVKANSSAEKLAEKLQELAEKENEASGLFSGLGKFYGNAFSSMVGYKNPKVVCIENFPVPNTREDLLEFLTSIQPKAKKPSFFTKRSAEYAMEHAYWALYSNCINRVCVESCG